MHAHIMERWLEALRNNTYQQGTGNLRTNKGYCCLGVLCDLHSKETGTEWRYNEFISSSFYLGEKFELPIEVMLWAGLDQCDPKVNGTKLSIHNDGDKDYRIKAKSFTELADLIQNAL